MASETFRKPVKAMCEDGVIRTVYVRCYRYDGSFAADTFFTVPAHRRDRGRYVAGYVYCDGLSDYAGFRFSAIDRGQCGQRVDNSETE